MAARDHVDAVLDEWSDALPAAATVELAVAKRTARLAARIAAVTAAAIEPSGLTYGEFDVVLTLRRAGSPFELRSRDLATRTALTTGGTSNIVNHLAGLGLITRQPDDTDKRSTLVRLTPAGVKCAEELAAASIRAHRELFAGVAPDDLENLSRHLKQTLLALGDE